MRSDKSPAVSVILPVYNIGGYLEQCMESLADQTFRDIEILLIDDGSTDDSPQRCRKWQERDDRVRYVRKENGGVSSARNLGLELAKGEYIAFVDPDDWLDETYIEKLYEAAVKSGADMAECDIWRYDNRSGRKIYRACYGRMGVPYTLEEHMKYGPTATYKSISRRSLWLDNGVKLPDCAFESPAVYSLMLALSRKTVSVREPLYYYRRFRENSLIENGYAHKDGTVNNTLGTEAMDHLISEFKRTGLYERYKDILPGVVIYRLNDILAMQFHRKAEEDFRQMTANYRSFVERTFPGLPDPVYFTWGGYNLNRILTHMDMIHDPFCRFNFSSIPSVVSGAPIGASVEHPNRYRRIMVERDLSGRFWSLLEQERPSVIFMDLIDERFDLLKTGGRYVTLSDAFAGSSLRDMEGTVVPFGSPECEEIWKESCRLFVERVKAAVPGIRFVVIRSLLCERVGTPGCLTMHPDTEGIRRINRVLESRYDHLMSILTDGILIDPAKDDLYFTDRNYEYGAVPSHLNEIENQAISERIRERIGGLLK